MQNFACHFKHYNLWSKLNTSITICSGCTTVIHKQYYHMTSIGTHILAKTCLPEALMKTWGMFLSQLIKDDTLREKHLKNINLFWWNFSSNLKGKQVLPRFELGSQDSESWVLTITPQNHEKSFFCVYFDGVIIAYHTCIIWFS